MWASIRGVNGVGLVRRSSCRRSTTRREMPHVDALTALVCPASAESARHGRATESPWVWATAIAVLPPLSSGARDSRRPPAAVGRGTHLQSTRLGERHQFTVDRGAARIVSRPAVVRVRTCRANDNDECSRPRRTPTFVIEGQVPASGSPARQLRDTPPSAVSPIDPTQMQAAYGVNLISFGGLKGTGSGQTIAIVDAYNDPTILADANTFSSSVRLAELQ